LTVSQEDAQSILRLDGYTFAGVNLSIQQEGDGKSHGTDTSTSAQGSNTSDVKSKMLGMLASRYDFDKLLLDLSALGADPTMIDLKAFETKALAEKTFKALLRLVSMRFDTKDAKEAAIQAVSLANNGIIDVKEVFDLARDLPRLRRLDLSNNSLQDFSGLSKWRHEFRRLEELYLVGNPVTNLPNYPKQIIEWFPSLQILDGQPVRTPEEAANALKEWFPQPIPALPSNLRDGGNNVASAFLSTFFPAYDSDRPGLLRQFYDDESVFSLVAEPEKDSAPYQTFSRNLEKFGSRDSAIHQRLFTGVNLISELWSRLPPTHHPNLTEEPLWKIDCHTFQNLADPLGMGSAAGLIINVRSRFEELDPATQTTITRQFHRCFILGPSKPGAPHPFRVVSDQLVVMPLQPLAAAPQVAPVAPTPVVQPVPAPLQAPVLADDVRANLIMEVSRRTGMTAEYSELCLSGMANWDLEMALRLFEEKRGELPPEAFLQPA
jgi:nuclear RNA export factor